MIKLQVKHEFADRADITKRYKMGEIHEFESDRAENLVKRGLCEKLNAKPSKKTGAVKDEQKEQVQGIDLDVHYKKIIAEVENTKDAETLIELLSEEQAGKTRKSVVEAIETQLSRL